MRGLLLAGGHGTRLRPLTFSGNKHMLPIANKPMILYGLEHLTNAGITEIGVILGPVYERIIEHLGDGSRFNCKITYIHQDEPKGIAHAVLMAEEFLQDEPFVVYLGDNLLKQGVCPLVETFRRNFPDCVICISEVENPHQYGVVELNARGGIHKLIEKPKSPRSKFALVGTYLFNKSIFEAIRNIKPSQRAELEITDAIQYLHEHGKRIKIIKVRDWWKDTGKPEDLLIANKLVLSGIKREIHGKVMKGAKVIGNVHVGTNSIIHSGAIIKGPAIIGQNCEIHSTVDVGPYASIDNNVKLVSGIITNSIVMENSIIDCNKHISNSIVGKNSILVKHSNSDEVNVRLGENSSIYF